MPVVLDYNFALWGVHMISNYFFELNLLHKGKKEAFYLPRFTNINKLLVEIKTLFNIDADICLYSFDWFRFLELEKNLDEQYIQNGFVIEVVDLENN